MNDTSPKFNTLSLDDAISEIIQTLETSENNPPFTLLLGSGFSFPVIPTTGQMVKKIPPWLREKANSDQDPVEFEKSFWQQIKTKQKELALDKDSQPVLSNADNTLLAYQGAMRHKLNSPALRRAFMRFIIEEGENKGKINPAHLYLADILDRQDNRDEKWEKRFSDKRFCGKIFTTNFDPLLQSSLQLVNKLYWMTDSPDSSDTPTDDAHDAIHLIYTHGNIHQYRMANTEAEIKEFANVQAPKLQPYFSRHGVIVIGYSGWNDACMTALEQCNQFDHNLYWCDIHPPKDAPDKLRADVVKFLTKHQGSAFYVHINSADDMSRRLHRQLGLGGTPSFLMNPLSPLIRQVEDIVVSGDLPHETNEPGDTLKDFIARTITRLKTAQTVFNNPEEQTNAPPDALISKHMNDAFLFYSAERYEDAIEQWIKVIELKDAPADQKAQALSNRGVAYGQLDPPQNERAIEDYTTVIEMDNVSNEQKAIALVNRGAAYGQLDPPQNERAIEDCTTVIEMDDASIEQKATALGNRGNAYYQLDPPQNEQAIEDYSTVIEMDDAPINQVARALVNRGGVYLAAIDMDDAPTEQSANDLANRGETLAKMVPPQIERIIEDYSTVIEMDDASTEQKARALVNRGNLYGKMDPPQNEKKLADYSAVIEMDASPTEQKTMALVNRGLTYGQMDPPQNENAIEDYSTIIEMGDAPAKQRAVALFGRAMMYGKQDPPELVKEIEDYTAVIQMHGAPVKQKAVALFSRGMTYGQMDPPEHDKAIEDYTAVIQMGDTIAKEKANALYGRAVIYGKLDPPEDDKAIEDCTAIIQMDNAPVEQKAMALFLRGATYGQMDPPERGMAIEDYTAVIQMNEAPAEQKAAALFGRGGTYSKLDPPNLGKVLADYTAMIQMDDAPDEWRAEAYGSLGWEHYKQGDYPASIESSRKGLALGSGRTYIQANLGLALLREGDATSAQKEYKHAIAEVQTIEDLDRIIRHDLRSAMDEDPSIAGADEVMKWADQRGNELQSS